MSSGTYSFRAFPLSDEESVAGVLGSEFFTPIEVESVAGVFASDVFYQHESIPMMPGSFQYFDAQIEDFLSKFQKSVL